MITPPNSFDDSIVPLRQERGLCERVATLVAVACAALLLIVGVSQLIKHTVGYSYAWSTTRHFFTSLTPQKGMIYFGIPALMTLLLGINCCQRRKTTLYDHQEPFTSLDLQNAERREV